MALNFKNCRIIVKDVNHDKVLADTRILFHDDGANTIRISVGDIQYVPMQDICMLIFGQKNMDARISISRRRWRHRLRDRRSECKI